jgi:hypothetical protein
MLLAVVFVSLLALSVIAVVFKWPASMLVIVGLSLLVLPVISLVFKWPAITAALGEFIVLLLIVIAAIFNHSKAMSEQLTLKEHLSQLIAEYEVLADKTEDTAARDLCQAIADQFRTCNKSSWTLTPPGGQQLTWADVNKFELALQAYTGDNTLKTTILRLRQRYRDAVGKESYTAYMASHPPDPDKARPEEIRADADFILGDILRNLNFSGARERLRTQLSQVAFFWMVAVVAGMVAAGREQSDPWLRMLSLSLLAGTIGGFISMQRRLQTSYVSGNPRVTLAQLTYGAWSMYLAPISGAVFGGLLYMMFAGGILSGSVFPSLVMTPSGDPPTVIAAFAHRGHVALPAPFPDFAKLMVWCFIAGFAERFVPDTIDRLTSASNAKGAENAAAKSGATAE